MNVIGEIGNFIIKYQEPIQAGVIAAIAIAAVVIICKLFTHARKKRELLSQINHTVSEINVTVEKIAGQSEGKKQEIVYIDNGASKLEKELQEIEKGLSALGKHPQAEEREEEPIEEQDECSTAEETPIASIEQEEKIEPTLKYFSRDCAVSKTGKQFTLEELNAQIKE